MSSIELKKDFVGIYYSIRGLGQQVMKERKGSVAKRMIASLEEFTEALEKGDISKLRITTVTKRKKGDKIIFTFKRKK